MIFLCHSLAIISFPYFIGNRVDDLLSVHIQKKNEIQANSEGPSQKIFTKFSMPTT